MLCPHDFRISKIFRVLNALAQLFFLPTCSIKEVEQERMSGMRNVLADSKGQQS